MASIHQVVFTFLLILSITAMHADGNGLFKILFGKWDFHRKTHQALGPPPKPVGGKERFDQICRVQKGIVACFN